MRKSAVFVGLILAGIALGSVLNRAGQASPVVPSQESPRVATAATVSPAAPSGPSTLRYEALRARLGASR